MKKIDIEKWERKNPKLPENFFDEMQEKVLAETTRKKEPKRFQLVAWASVAAVIVFGVMIFFNNDKKPMPELAITPKENLIIDTQYIEPIIENEKTQELAKPVAKKVEFVVQKVEKKAQPKPKAVAEEKPALEEVMNTMTESELGDLAMNYEQDTFLELY